MNITPEENDLLLELASKYDYPDYDPNKHILRKQMVEVWNVSENGVSYRLNKMIQEGKLKMEKVRMPSGSVCNGYYRD